SMVDGLASGFYRSGNLRLGGSADDEVVGFRVVPLAPTGTDGRPESGLIKMTDRNASMAGRGGRFTIALGDDVVRRHLACCRQLHGGSEIQPGLAMDRTEGGEDCREADFGVPVAGGDRGMTALRARQKRAIDLFSKRPQRVPAEAGERHA